MKKVFKENDKVFHIQYGWGIVVNDNYNSNDYKIRVNFGELGNNIGFTIDGKWREDDSLPTLSFTEYTLNEFSQERPINYDEWVGKWCKFWDHNENCFIIDILSEIRSKTCFTPKQYGTFRCCKPLTEEQIKILGL